MKCVVINGHDYYETEDGRRLPAICGGEPTTIAVLTIAVTIAAASASAYMQYQQGQQEAKAHEYNERLAENQARQAKFAADARARDIRERNRRVLATVRANAGTSGVALAPGTSPLAVLAYDAQQGELDALRAEYGGTIEAAGLRDQARLQGFAAENARYAGAAGAGSTLLSGFGSAASGAYGLHRGAGALPTGYTRVSGQIG